LCFLALPGAASACSAAFPLDLREVLRVDAVVEAKVVRYEERLNEENSREPYATLDLQVFKVLYGNVGLFREYPESTRVFLKLSHSRLDPEKAISGFKVISIISSDKIKSGLGRMRAIAGLDGLYVYNETCSIKSFMFEREGMLGRAVRHIFIGRGDPAVKADILASFLEPYTYEAD
jgi:hypothetical protein